MSEMMRISPDKVKPGYRKYALAVDIELFKSRVESITLEETAEAMGEVLTEEACIDFLKDAESRGRSGVEEDIIMSFNMTRVMGALCAEIIDLKKSVAFLEEGKK